MRIIQMQKELINPFINRNIFPYGRAFSLLNYGEDNFSLFDRLSFSSQSYKKINKITTKQIEQKLMHKLERQLYSMDQTGHCQAEFSFNQKLTQAEQITQEDFWTRLKYVKPKYTVRKVNQIIITIQTEQDKISFIDTTETYTGSSLNRLKNERHLLRQEMLNMKKMIQKRQNKMRSKEQNKENFSLIKMYKRKQLQKNQQDCACTKLSDHCLLVPQFTKIQLSSSLSSYNEFLLKVNRSQLSSCSIYPKSILLRNINYQYVQLI